MRQEVTLLGSSFGTRSRSSSPRSFRLGSDKLRQFVSSEPRLASYRFYVEEILRTAAHTLSEARRKNPRHARTVTAAPSDDVGIAPECRIPISDHQRWSDGRAVQGRSADVRASSGSRTTAATAKKRCPRISARFGNFSQTFGSTLSGSVRSSQFYATVRKYDSDLAARLDSSNIPVPVYARLIRGRQSQSPGDFHRYLKLRKRMMGVERASLLRPLRAARRLGEPRIHAGGSAPAHRGGGSAAGPDYVSTIHRAFNERWIDLMPNEASVGRLRHGRGVRRAPVHADQLRRQVLRHVHRRARARARMHSFPLESSAAVPPGGI
jgi:oligoendopeptidase F